MAGLWQCVSFAVPCSSSLGKDGEAETVRVLYLRGVLGLRRKKISGVLLE